MASGTSKTQISCEPQLKIKLHLTRKLYFEQPTSTTVSILRRLLLLTSKKLVFLLNYFCIFCCFSFFVTFRNFWLESLWKWLHDILPNPSRPTVISPNDNHFGQRSSYTSEARSNALSLAAIPKRNLLGYFLMNAWLPVIMTSTG